MTRLLSVTLSAVLLFACSTSTEPPTDGGTDAHTGDASGTDLGSTDATTHDAPPTDAPSTDAPGTDAPSDDGGNRACGTSTCGPGEICITGRCAGCCDIPPACIPMPAGCTGTPSCGCFTTDPCGGCTTCLSANADTITCGNCMCVCAAAWSPIDTPDGPRAIADLRVGDLVYSVDRGEVVVVPIARLHHTAVTRHALVRVTLAGGGVVEMSGGHPTGDGGRFDALVPGARLGDEEILSVETEPYDAPFTYDILPASDTGTYFVAGAWVGSTLAEPR